jgi:hypothetical protein
LPLEKNEHSRSVWGCVGACYMLPSITLCYNEHNICGSSCKQKIQKSWNCVKPLIKMYLKQKDVKWVNGFICQRTDTSARLLEAQELTFGCHKNWKNYWHTNLFRIKDILDYSVIIHCIIYWVIFANLFNSLFYYMIIYLFALDIYLTF